MSTKKKISFLYHANPLSYGIAENPHKQPTITRWTRCRERFHNNVLPSTGFVYSFHKSVEREKISEFINTMENRLNLKEESKFYPVTSNCDTPKVDYLWVRPCGFWFRCMPGNIYTRFYLYSILLRCASDPNKQDCSFDEKLFAQNEILTTQYAVKRFMSGYTYFTGGSRIWSRLWVKPLKQKESETKSQYQTRIDELLAIPPEKRKFCCPEVSDTGYSCAFREVATGNPYGETAT